MIEGTDRIIEPSHSTDSVPCSLLEACQSILGCQLLDEYLQIPAVPSLPNAMLRGGTGASRDGVTTDVYQLIPVLELPTLDLQLSVKSRLPRMPSVLYLLRVFAASRLSLVGYCVGIVITVGVFFLPIHVARLLGCVGCLVGLPAAIVGIVTLRYEMVLVLLRTYDIWFFGIVSTLSLTLLVIFLGDVRAAIVLILWLGFFVDVFIDANLNGVRSVWIVNMVSCLMVLVGAITITMDVVPVLKPLPTLDLNGHALPMLTFLRDGMLSMGVVILRNAFRRHQRAKIQELTQVENKITIQCVSFRCRLKLQRVPPTVLTSAAISNMQRQSTVQLLLPSTTDIHGTNVTQLRLAYEYRQVIDAGLTVLPLPARMRHFFCASASSAKQTRIALALRVTFYLLGSLSLWVAIGFVALDVFVPMTKPSKVLYLLACTSAGGSFLFLAICLALSQRLLLRQIISSFDFLYITSQLLIIHVTYADLCFWRPCVTIALAGTCSWSIMILCWDALLPSTRSRLGLNTRAAARAVTELVLMPVIFGSLSIFFLPTHRLNDRVFFAFDVLDMTIHVRSFVWYVSSAVTIVAWVVRVLWRFWRATEEELVFLDGATMFSYTRPLGASLQGSNAVMPSDPVDRR